MMKILLLHILPVVVFISCRESDTAKNKTDWVNKGDSIVAKTFDTLRNTLLKTIGEKGFAGAVSFCNTEAMNLTNTFSSKGITIKRTSDKLRNPANAPDKMEQEILVEYNQGKRNNQELKPVLKKDKTGNHHYFKPILIQSVCLNCHGAKPAQIKPETWDTIRQYYPADSAFNYKDGDLRGIWHVVFVNPR